jgi:hypothetical protein
LKVEGSSQGYAAFREFLPDKNKFSFPFPKLPDVGCQENQRLSGLPVRMNRARPALAKIIKAMIPMANKTIEDGYGTAEVVAATEKSDGVTVPASTDHST